MPIAVLADQLEAAQFHWKVRTTHQGHITHLLFTAHESIRLYKRYPEMLLLDCAYKTNQFKMLLLNMRGITGMNTTFYVGFAFICTEQESNFA